MVIPVYGPGLLPISGDTWRTSICRTVARLKYSKLEYFLFLFVNVQKRRKLAIELIPHYANFTPPSELPAYRRFCRVITQQK